MLAWFDTAFLEIKGATYNSNNTMLQLNYKGGNTKDGVPAPHESEDILNRNDKSELHSLFRECSSDYHKMVRVGRLELPASCSQSKRATNCATPGYEVF